MFYCGDNGECDMANVRCDACGKHWRRCECYVPPSPEIAAAQKELLPSPPPLIELELSTIAIVGQVAVAGFAAPLLHPSRDVMNIVQMLFDVDSLRPVLNAKSLGNSSIAQSVVHGYASPETCSRAEWPAIAWSVDLCLLDAHSPSTYWLDACVLDVCSLGVCPLVVCSLGAHLLGDCSLVSCVRASSPRHRPDLQPPDTLSVRLSSDRRYRLRGMALPDPPFNGFEWLCRLVLPWSTRLQYAGTGNTNSFECDSAHKVAQITCSTNWFSNIDVTTAFMQVKIEEQPYCSVPDGIVYHPQQVKLGAIVNQPYTYIADPNYCLRLSGGGGCTDRGQVESGSSYEAVNWSGGVPAPAPYSLSSCLMLAVPSSLEGICLVLSSVELGLSIATAQQVCYDVHAPTPFLTLLGMPSKPLHDHLETTSYLYIPHWILQYTMCTSSVMLNHPNEASALLLKFSPLSFGSDQKRRYREQTQDACEEDDKGILGQPSDVLDIIQGYLDVNDLRAVMSIRDFNHLDVARQTVHAFQIMRIFQAGLTVVRRSMSIEQSMHAVIVDSQRHPMFVRLRLGSLNVQSRQSYKVEAKIAWNEHQVDEFPVRSKGFELATTHARMEVLRNQVHINCFCMAVEISLSRALTLQTAHNIIRARTARALHGDLSNRDRRLIITKFDAVLYKANWIPHARLSLRRIGRYIHARVRRLAVVKLQRGTRRMMLRYNITMLAFVQSWTAAARADAAEVIQQALRSYLLRRCTPSNSNVDRTGGDSRNAIDEACDAVEDTGGSSHGVIEESYGGVENRAPLMANHGADNTSYSSQSSLVAMAAVASTLRSEPTGTSEVNEPDMTDSTMVACLSEKVPTTVSPSDLEPTDLGIDVMTVNSAPEPKAFMGDTTTNDVQHFGKSRSRAECRSDPGREQARDRIGYTSDKRGIPPAPPPVRRTGLLGGARGDGRDGILHERQFRVLTMQRSVRRGTIMSRCDDPRLGQRDAWWVKFDDADHAVKQDLVPGLRLGRTDVLTRIGHWATVDDDPSGGHWDGREICKVCFCPSNEDTCPVCKTTPMQQMVTRSSAGSSSSSSKRKHS